MRKENGLKITKESIKRERRKFWVNICPAAHGKEK